MALSGQVHLASPLDICLWVAVDLFSFSSLKKNQSSNKLQFFFVAGKEKEDVILVHPHNDENMLCAPQSFDQADVTAYFTAVCSVRG